MTSFERSTVLVTGAAAGIGKRLCDGALDRGSRVVAWDLDPDKLAQLEADRALAVEQGRLLTARVDVSDREQVRAAAERVRAAAGGVDIVINNAGVVSGKMIMDLEPEQIERTMRVNVLALFWTTQAFLPDMVRHGSGHIVSVASAAGLLGVRRQTDYSASKHAVVGFDASLRAELRATAPGVRTTMVAPFYVDTGMFHGAKTRVPWMLPILSEEFVTERILKSVERNRARVFLPPVVRALYLGQFLPTPVFDWMMDLLGVHVSMDEFVGHKGVGTTSG